MTAARTREVLRGWGGVHQGRSWVYRPRSADEAAEALADASARGLTVAHRGSGLSYGDLALNEGGAVVETRALAGILSLDADTGVVRARAGTTIEELWTHALPLGWWPPVVPGTMKVTLGGAVAVNVHGKNHFTDGSFGDHVVGVTLLEPGGATRTLTAAADRTALAGVIAGLGLGGTLLEVAVRLQRVHAGLLEVETRATRSLAETMDALEAGAAAWKHAVAWVDCFPRGAAAGRGIVDCARDLPADHARAGAAMTVAEQALPGRILGLVPRRHAWVGLRAFLHDPGMRALYLGRWLGAPRGRRAFVSHARFHFLLDSMPGWQRAYGPHGLVQYQMFVPREAARRVFGEALRLQHAAGLPSYLAVAKRHRADPFPASYMMDGFSLALDFPVRPRTMGALTRLFRSFDALLAEAGGRIYAAKDGTGRGLLPAARHPLFSSNLVRRWQGGVR